MANKRLEQAIEKWKSRSPFVCTNCDAEMEDVIVRAVAIVEISFSLGTRESFLTQNDEVREILEIRCGHCDSVLRSTTLAFVLAHHDVKESR